MDGYLPVFLKLEDKKVLIVGAGKVAYRKLTFLLQFTSNITILSDKFGTNILNIIDKYNLNTINRAYLKGDIKDYDIIILAIDNIPLQKKIYEESKIYNCLVNSVDSKEYCDFILGASIKKGDLTISISTNGISPSVSKYIKKYIMKILPNDIDIFLKKMKKYRKTIAKGEKRMKLFDKKVKKYLRDRGLYE